MDYEQKQAARRERLERAAESAGSRASAAAAKARAIGDAIPFGQPILVGHHSEGRARRDARRIHASMGRAVAESERAVDLARRAAAVGTAGVSSDDPGAIAKLEAELVTLREKQALMVAVNAALRKHAKDDRGAQINALAAVGWHLRPVEVIEAGGFARYQLTNNGANARRIEKRIAELRAKAAAPVRDPIVGPGYAIVEDRESNRVQIRFDARPPAATVAALKARGFRWAPSENAWQRQAGNGAWHAALAVAASLDSGEIVP